MSTALCEQLVARILTYVSAMGVRIDREVSIAALELAVDALLHDDQNPIAYAMDRLPEQLALPTSEIPQLAPPIRRRSIRYRKR